MQKRAMVRLRPEILEQLLEVKRLTSLPVQSSVDRAVVHWLDNAAPPILEKMGVTPQQMEHLSQMRLGKPPTSQPAAGKKSKLA